MIEIIKRHRVAITCSIVASLLVLYAIEPLLNWVMETTTLISNYLGTAYEDRLYQNLATMESSDFSFVLVVMFFFAPVIIVSSSGFATNVRKLLKSTAKEEQNRNKTNTDVSKSKKSGVIKRYVDNFPRLRTFIFASISLLVSLMSIDSIAKYQFQWPNLVEFRHHMRIIAPYIDSEKEKLIISKWSQMKNRNDYDKIYVELNSISGQNNITLPKRTM